MSSTIGWLAMAIAAGSLAGVTIGHWPVVAGWLHRCLEDPVGRPGVADGEAPPAGRLRRHGER